MSAVVAGVLIPLVIIVVGVAIFLIYLFYRRTGRFPWQKGRGTAYTVPVAIYHEVENIRSERDDYDYAEPVVVFTEDRRGKTDQNEEEYDHLGDEISIKGSQYDTTASAAQMLNRSPSQELVPRQQNYNHSNIKDRPASKVLDNKYETVLPLNQVPRSPESIVGSSPDYNHLTTPKPQRVIQNEYDKPSTQGLQDEQPTSLSVKDKSTNKNDKVMSLKPVPSARKNKKDNKTSVGDTYVLAKAPGANSNSSEHTKEVGRSADDVLVSEPSGVSKNSKVQDSIARFTAGSQASGSSKDESQHYSLAGFCSGKTEGDSLPGESKMAATPIKKTRRINIENKTINGTFNGYECAKPIKHTQHR